MKKFITYVPMQVGNNLLKGRYIANGNHRLRMEAEVIFPIECILNGYAEDGEAVELIALLEAGNADCRENLSRMVQAIEARTKPRHIDLLVKTVTISPEELAKNHLETFKNLISLFADGDELYACVTFGTKPTPIIQMMALNFAYKNLKNVTIGCIAYGKVNREQNQPVSFYIYDITALFFMNNIVDTLSAINAEDAYRKIEKILRLGVDDESRDD